eukprot:5999052-Amphidinium_carterae.2
MQNTNVLSGSPWTNPCEVAKLAVASCWPGMWIGCTGIKCFTNWLCAVGVLRSMALIASALCTELKAYF